MISFHIHTVPTFVQRMTLVPGVSQLFCRHHKNELELLLPQTYGTVDVIVTGKSE